MLPEADTADPLGPGRAVRKRRPKPPPSTVVIFVRHGNTPTTGKVLPGRAPGLHLSDVGRAEAEAVAQRLAGAPGGRKGDAPGRLVCAVYASPLERTEETAAPIAAALGLPLMTEEGLIEMDFGEWTGAELKVLRKLPEWNAVQRFPSGFQFPGGEAFSAMSARMAATIATLCRRHPGQTIVAVSHADPIKAAVSHALGTHLDLFQRIHIAPCSLSAISYSPEGPTVLAVNTNAPPSALGVGRPGHGPSGRNGSPW